MNKKTKKIIVITGPTASGKSDYAIKLAQDISGEVINADIGSFYEPLSIGTAKPDWKNESVPHHLFDILKDPISFSIVKFRDILIRKCKELWSKGKTPVIVGGSTMYIQSCFYKQPIIEETDTYIKELEQSDVSTIELFNELTSIDSIRSKQIARNDRYRITRALAIYKATGKKPSSLGPFFEPIAPYELIICSRDREELYNRINYRTEKMINEGWVEEVSALVDTPWENFLHHKKIMGYDVILNYLDKKISKQEMIATIQKLTRNYAKRQVTFFRRIEKMLLDQNYPSGTVKKVSMS